MANKGKTPIPKTQREIINSQIEPYDPPSGAPGFSERGNPNNVGTPNRATQISFRDDNTKPFTLGIKDIDEAIMYYMEEVIKPTVTFIYHSLKYDILVLVHILLVISDSCITLFVV